MFRRFAPPTVTFLTLWLASCATVPSPRPLGTRMVPEATLTPLASRFCRTDNEVDLLVLRVAAVLRNPHSVPLLHFPEPVITMIEVLPGRSAADEPAVNPFRLEFDFVGPAVPIPIDWASVRVLDPGGTYRFELDVRITVARQGYAGGAGISTGAHLVKVELVPFWGGEADRIEAMKRFRGRGAFWIEPTDTALMPLAVPAQRTVVSCD